MLVDSIQLESRLGVVGLGEFVLGFDDLECWFLNKS